MGQGARGREGVWVWGPALSVDPRMVPGVEKSLLHSEASVGALGMSWKGMVCHLLLVAILLRTKREHARHI
jgi:hypothetical protein